MRIPDFHFLDSAYNLHRLSLIEIGGDGVVRKPRQAAEQYPAHDHHGISEFPIHEFPPNWIGGVAT